MRSARQSRIPFLSATSDRPRRSPPSDDRLTFLRMLSLPPAGSIQSGLRLFHLSDRSHPDRQAGKGLSVHNRSGEGAGVQNRRGCPIADIVCVRRHCVVVLALNSFCDPGPADWIWTAFGVGVILFLRELPGSVFLFGFRFTGCGGHAFEAPAGGICPPAAVLPCIVALSWCKLLPQKPLG